MLLLRVLLLRMQSLGAEGLEGGRAEESLLRLLLRLLLLLLLLAWLGRRRRAGAQWPSPWMCG